MFISRRKFAIIPKPVVDANNQPDGWVWLDWVEECNGFDLITGASDYTWFMRPEELSTRNSNE